MSKKHFCDISTLSITIQTNQKIVNYLDVTFDLNNGSYKPYRKPDNTPLYINVQSNHPPPIEFIYWSSVEG